MFGTHYLPHFTRQRNKAQRECPVSNPAAPGCMCHSCHCLENIGLSVKHSCESIYLHIPHVTNTSNWPLEDILGPSCNIRKMVTSIPSWWPGWSSVATVPQLGFFFRLWLPSTEGRVHQREVFLETNQIHIHPAATLKDKAKPAHPPSTVGHAVAALQV